VLEQLDQVRNLFAGVDIHPCFLPPVAGAIAPDRAPRPGARVDTVSGASLS
jgi:hypothetical protein